MILIEKTYKQYLNESCETMKLKKGEVMPYSKEKFEHIPDDLVHSDLERRRKGQLSCEQQVTKSSLLT
jgi:hypothetical protein